MRCGVPVYDLIFAIVARIRNDPELTSRAAPSEGTLEGEFRKRKAAARTFSRSKRVRQLRCIASASDSIGGFNLITAWNPKLSDGALAVEAGHAVRKPAQLAGLQGKVAGGSAGIE